MLQQFGLNLFIPHFNFLLTLQHVSTFFDPNSVQSVSQPPFTWDVSTPAGFCPSLSERTADPTESKRPAHAKLATHGRAHLVLALFGAGVR